MKKRKKKQEAFAPYEKKKSNRGAYLVALILTTLVVFTVYQVFVALESMAVLWVYLALACVLGVLFVVFNRGLSTRPTTADELPDDWDYERKSRYMTEEQKSRRVAKILLVPFFALVLTFLLDALNLFYFDRVRELLTSLFGG